jgi:hypothetical protein
MWRSSTDVAAPLWGASSISFGSFSMAFTHRQTVLYKGVCVPKPSFSDLLHSRELVLNKTRNYIMFSHPSISNFLAVLLIHSYTATDITQAMYLCNSSNSATSATHVICDQSYQPLHSAATIHKTSEMTHIEYNLNP